MQLTNMHRIRKAHSACCAISLTGKTTGANQKQKIMPQTNTNCPPRIMLWRCAPPDLVSCTIFNERNYIIGMVINNLPCLQYVLRPVPYRSPGIRSGAYRLLLSLTSLHHTIYFPSDSYLYRRIAGMDLSSRGGQLFMINS